MRGRHEEPAPALPKTRLGSGMDRQTDTQVAETVYQVYGLDASVPTQTAKEVQKERGKGRTALSRREDRAVCVPSTPGCPRYSRTFASLPHFSAARFLRTALCCRCWSAGAQLRAQPLAMSPLCALQGDTAMLGTAAAATRDHRPGDRSWPRDPPRPRGARRHIGGPSWGLSLPPLSNRVAGTGGYLWC